MNNYKYISKRPLVDPSISEKLMDFEEISTRVSTAQDFRKIRNAGIAAFIIAISLLTVFFNDITNLNTFSNEEGSLNGEKNLMDSSQSYREIVEDTIKKEPILENISIDSNAFDKKDFQEKSTHEIEKSKNIKIKEKLPPKKEFIQAAPISGFEKLYTYFNDHMLYPDSLKNSKIEGSVTVEFSITRDSLISDIKVLQGLHPVLDSIAVSAVKNMPKWKPAMINDEPYVTKHSIPLIFKIENNE